MLELYRKIVLVFKSHICIALRIARALGILKAELPKQRVISLQRTGNPFFNSDIDMKKSTYLLRSKPISLDTSL